jgi:hypothetical protein
MLSQSKQNVPLHLVVLCQYGISLCCKLHVCFAGRYTKHTFHLWRCLLWLGKDSLRKVIQLIIIRIYAPLGIILLHLEFICFSKYFCTVQDINIILLDLAYQYVMSCGAAAGQLLFRNLALLTL